MLPIKIKKKKKDHMSCQVISEANICKCIKIIHNRTHSLKTKNTFSSTKKPIDKDRIYSVDITSACPVADFNIHNVM